MIKLSWLTTTNKFVKPYSHPSTRQTAITPVPTRSCFAVQPNVNSDLNFHVRVTALKAHWL